MSFTKACDEAQRLFLVSNYRAPQIVRVLQQLRVEWGYKLLPIDEKAWLKLRNMNDHTTTQGYDHLRVYTLDDANHFSDNPDATLEPNRETHCLPRRHRGYQSA